MPGYDPYPEPETAEKYIAAPAKSLRDYHPEAQVYTEMDPSDFLDSLGAGGDPSRDFYVDEDSYKTVRDRMVAGQEIDPLFIDYDPFQKKVVRHEGRHRALAASQLGIERVPVIVWFYDAKGYHDVKDQDGRVYDESHYIPLEELGEGRINSALARLGAERTYGIPSQSAARRTHARRDLSVHVSGHRRRA